MKMSTPFTISTKTELKKFYLPFKISADYRFFYSKKDLPTELSTLEDAPHGDREYFESFSDLKARICDLIGAYEVSFIEETKSKVILYRIGNEEINRGFGRIIEFRFCVAQKVIIGNHKRQDIKYYEERTDLGYTTGNSLTQINEHAIFDGQHHEMSWTRAREDWFIEMDRQLSALAKLLESGIGKRPEVLARRIDQGGKLLLSGGAE